MVCSEVERVGLKDKSSLVKLIFAFLPTHCRMCGRFIWFKLFYGIPWYYQVAYDRGPFNNDHHCTSCHKKMIKEDGKCVCCDVVWSKH